MNNDLLIIQRTLEQTVDSYGRVHVRPRSEDFFLNGVPIDRYQAELWTQGIEYIDPIVEHTPPEPETMEPGLHEINLMDINLPCWRLVHGYPVGAAALISQLSANTTQQPQYLVDDSGRAYVVIPNPDSPHRADRTN